MLRIGCPASVFLASCLTVWSCATRPAAPVEQPSAAVQPEPETRLGVSGDVRCEEVWIDGDGVGPTPVDPRPVDPGAHSVRCRNRGTAVFVTDRVP